MNATDRKRTFEAWLTAHRGLVAKVVRAYAASAHDADDLFQEITAQLWLSVPNFDGQSKVSTWIYRVALFTAITWTRKERRHRHGREPLVDLTADDPGADPRIGWLYRRIAELEPVDRSLMLLLLEGLSYQEMASMLGISESNVGVRIHRIKKRFGGEAREG